MKPPRERAVIVSSSTTHGSEPVANAEPKHGHAGRRKQRVLNQDRSALVRSIARAVVIKEEDLFFLCLRDGRVPLQQPHGFGLYYHDCRFLNGYELRLAGVRPSSLIATASEGYRAALELTNPDLHLAAGKLMQKEDLALRWERVLDAPHLQLCDVLTFCSHAQESCDIPVSLQFQAGFEDVFSVRGMPTRQRGQLRPPAWENDELHFQYTGSDEIERHVWIRFSPAPSARDTAGAQFTLALAPGQSVQLGVTIRLQEIPPNGSAAQSEPQASDPKHVAHTLRQSSDAWLQGQARVQSNSLLFDRALERSLRDLRVLRARLQGLEYFAAGVPWYVALFGRDSLISSLQSLAFQPEVAEQTLRLLARYQGKAVDDWRDEEPGKILHELRVGELAHTNQIPQTPYYGSIDATPLFLILLCRHAAWTGNVRVFKDLREAVEAALQWMAQHGDLAGEGYLAYRRKSKQGLGNQGWKDSGDAIVNADGSLAEPPIALAEVQGYVYEAKIGLADLYRRTGEADRASQLELEARDLAQRFNADFWLPDKHIYALALQAGKRPAAVVASNAGQVLWSGIADADKARATANRLMAEDVFSGWGIRTLSRAERRYNPIGYHLGTVWPHDNSLILAGFRRYGRDEEACRLCQGILEASSYFASSRLPEVFAGFGRQEYDEPVHYPVACHPQAWAAGTLPYMLESLLGLTAHGFERRLIVRRPVLPGLIEHLEIHGLRIGPGRVDLRLRREKNGRLAVDLLRTHGDVSVAVEDADRA